MVETVGRDERGSRRGDGVSAGLLLERPGTTDNLFAFPASVTGAPEKGLDALILVRRTGAIMEAWTRDGVPRDVVGVMAATLVGSIDALTEAMGGPHPRRVSFVTESQRVVVERMPGDAVLVLAAAMGSSARVFRTAARRARRRLTALPARAPESIPASPAVWGSAPDRRRR